MWTLHRRARSPSAGVTVSTGTAYAMGRIGASPRFFASNHLRRRTPQHGIMVAFVASIVVAVGLGSYFDPFIAFALVGTEIVFVLVASYLLVNAARVGYFLKTSGPKLHPLLLGVVWLVYIYRTQPARAMEVGTVHLDLELNANSETQPADARSG